MSTSYIDFFSPDKIQLQFIGWFHLLGFVELVICPHPLDLAGGQGREEPVQKRAIKGRKQKGRRWQHEARKRAGWKWERMGKEQSDLIGWESICEGTQPVFNLF